MNHIVCWSMFSLLLDDSDMLYLTLSISLTVVTICLYSSNLIACQFVIACIPQCICYCLCHHRHRHTLPSLNIIYTLKNYVQCAAESYAMAPNVCIYIKVYAVSVCVHGFCRPVPIVLIFERKNSISLLSFFCEMCLKW